RGSWSTGGQPFRLASAVSRGLRCALCVTQNVERPRRGVKAGRQQDACPPNPTRLCCPTLFSRVVPPGRAYLEPEDRTPCPTPALTSANSSTSSSPPRSA